MAGSCRVGYFSIVSCLLVLSLRHAPVVHAGDTSAWKSATIYQLLTDRFAGSNASCDLRKYCGGTFTGVQSKASSYLKKLGFDAVWISPVVENTPDGYHGYWAKNFSSINPEFGTSEELKQLVKKLRQLGIKVMVDVVANHIGYLPEPFDQAYPFNASEHYHNCTDCNPFCNIPDSAFALQTDRDKYQVEHCRLAGLPDLDQDNPVVRRLLLDWVRNLVQEYGFDGMRIDTIPQVKKEFWKEFVETAGVFAIGEVFNGDPAIVGPFQQYIPSTMNYPMFYTIRDVFAFQRGMWDLHNRREQNKQSFKDPSVLATFVDNHDNPRFFSFQRDWHLY